MDAEARAPAGPASWSSASSRMRFWTRALVRSIPAARSCPRALQWQRPPLLIMSGGVSGGERVVTRVVQQGEGVASPGRCRRRLFWMSGDPKEVREQAVRASVRHAVPCAL